MGLEMGKGGRWDWVSRRSILLIVGIAHIGYGYPLVLDFPQIMFFVAGGKLASHSTL